jgi:hypothetical protein
MTSPSRKPAKLQMATNGAKSSSKASSKVPT